MSNMDLSQQIFVVVVSLLGGGTVGVLGVKAMNRRIDGATADKIKAEAQQIATATSSASAQEQVQMMRTFVQDMRNGYETKLEENAADKASQQAEIKNLTARVSKLEERERHMLTRAAVHEAWDQMAFKIISEMNPQFAEPPPLILPSRSSD